LPLTIKGMDGFKVFRAIDSRKSSVRPSALEIFCRVPVGRFGRRQRKGSRRAVLLASQRNRRAAIDILGASGSFRRRDWLTGKPGLNFLPLPPLPTVA